MNGMHITLIGGIGLVVIAYWLISHASGARTIGVGGAQAFGSVARTFNKSTGAP